MERNLPPHPFLFLNFPIHDRISIDCPLISQRLIPAKTDNTKRDPENTSYYKPIIAYFKPNVFMVFIFAFIELHRGVGQEREIERERERERASESERASSHSGANLSHLRNFWSEFLWYSGANFISFESFFLTSYGIAEPILSDLRVFFV